MQSQDISDITDLVVNTMKDNVDRFKRYGKLLTRMASKGKEKAKIGQLDSKIFIVFYPDGTYDRFEEGPGSVTYRAGWEGPDLTGKGVIEAKEPEVKVEQAKVIQEKPASKPAKKTSRSKKTVSAGWAATLEMMLESAIESASAKKTVRKPAAKKTAVRKSKTVH